jgi:hypothetical protein
MDNAIPAQEGQTDNNNELEQSSNIKTKPQTRMADAGTICPNCGSQLQSRKCKLLCTRPGCGYMVTCSEW